MRLTVRSLTSVVAVSLVLGGSAAAVAVSPAAAGATTSTFPPPAPARRAPRTMVDPLTLSRGPAPRVVYYNQRQHLIHNGTRVIPARFSGTVTKLARVAGGYLLDNENAGGSVLRLVSGTGRTRVLARVANYGIFGLVSADRRTMVYYPSVRRTRAVVMRLADGRVLASRSFRNAQARVVAVRPHRALLSNGVHTFWWAYRGNRTTRVAADPVSQAALDLDRLVFARHGSDRQYMTSLDPQHGPSWSWRRGQPAGRFSPNGRRILTLTPQPGSRYDGAYVGIRVRGTRHGRVARVFTGRFGLESFEQDPRWETSSTFLTLALQPTETAGRVTRMAWVRCTVRGSCQNASPVFRVDTSVPPYGPSPWVLATQPTH